MSWRWAWQRPVVVDGPNPAAHGSRSREVWSDLTQSDAVIAHAAELAARQAAELAALERVLNEPTMILERGVRVPPFVVAYRRAGRWEVRHA
jgi:F420-dependent methylenetetrahydromethanopterin dehydrogenase